MGEIARAGVRQEKVGFAAMYESARTIMREHERREAREARRRERSVKAGRPMYLAYSYTDD